jgi:hypothetical protein
MERFLSVCIFCCALSFSQAETLWTEGFETAFPPSGWTTNSVDQSATYVFSGHYSARLNALGDYLITPPISNAQTLIFWSYTTAADPPIIVEYAPTVPGPWTAVKESPFSGYTEQWNGQSVDLSELSGMYVRFRKTGSGTLYIDDVSVETGGATHNVPPVLDPIGNRTVIEQASLSFSVTASDPTDNDPVKLTATNLPPGAVFTNGVFVWNTAAPVGTYAVTFSATDKDGTDSETVIIAVADAVIGNARLAGNCYGWSGDTIFKLETGKFWQQSTFGAAPLSPALYKPYVTITEVFGQRRMTITNVAGYVAVMPLAVTESSVTGTFSGLHYQNTYQLADGTTWKQISFENIPGAASPVTVWRWIKNGQQMLRFLDHNDAVIGTCNAEVSAPPVNPPVVSSIDGYFRGWQRQRIFALANGQFWQQTSSGNSVQTLYRPAVTVTYNLSAGSWRMSIAGLSDDVTVQRLTNVTHTAVDGTFYGFGQRKIFRMADSTWWRQTSPESSASTRSNPEIFIYNNYLDMPDEGLRVAAEKLNVIRECTITNLFAGLHYGNLYQLACGETWMQLCFENVRTNAVSPTVMLWRDGTKTSLLIRDRRNAIIGSCLVVNPVHDADRDGVCNADEVTAGSDPDDPASALLTSINCPPISGRVLNWQAVEGRIYKVEWKPSLTESFQTLETGILWPQNSWTDTVHAAETRGYYRITVRRAE